MTIQDVVKEHVLCFLPAKSLCRFRLVCKEWNYWITHPFLVHLHSYSFRDISGIFCQTATGTPFFISLDRVAYGVQDPALRFLLGHITIRAASNGLLCCQSFLGDEFCYYICNPATKEWKVLPEAKLYHGPNSAVALNFQPSVLNFKANFELVCAVPIPDSKVVRFEIYSSRSDSWRILDTECYEPAALELKDDGFCLKGVAFWETCRGTVLAFHLSDEQYGMLKTPPSTGSSSSQGFLTEMRGELCYIVPRGLRVDIYGGWDMRFKYHKTLDSAIPGRINNGKLRLLPCVNGEVMMVLFGNRFLCAYKVKEGKTKMTSTSFGHRYVGNEYVKCLPYVNSLVPVGRQIVESEDFYY